MEKSRLYLLLLIGLFPFALKANGPLQKYLVYLNGKDTRMDIRSLYSARALEKRAAFHLAFEERDYPVSEAYVSRLKAAHAEVLGCSGWLNAVMVRADAASATLIRQLPFVSKMLQVSPKTETGIAAVAAVQACSEVQAAEYENGYSESYAQFHLLNGDYLHQLGYNGENMVIAICDGGFTGTNTNGCFDHVRNEHRLLGTYDYVNNDSMVYESISHGTNVFSCIAGLLQNPPVGPGPAPDSGQYIGTARKASFYLFMTENAPTERLQEEFNLAVALERCAQLGVDVVNISLGYTTFDVPSENHDTSDMMKNNTPAAIAVNIAANKGMLVCVAAGNEGASAWHYISTPSDADSAMAVAAVDVNGNVASFSGWGLANDPRVKPNVAAVGWNMKVISSSNTVVTGSGTSFASPSLAGMSACLWQAFPHKSNWEIKTAIEQSASQYLNPDKHIGYGIPDFKKAYEILSLATFAADPKLEQELTVYPNPFNETVYINNHSNTSITSIQLLNNIGQVVYAEKAPVENTLSLNDLPRGMYIMEVATGHGMLIKKLIKD